MGERPGMVWSCPRQVSGTGFEAAWITVLTILGTYSHGRCARMMQITYMTNARSLDFAACERRARGGGGRVCRYSPNGIVTKVTR